MDIQSVIANNIREAIALKGRILEDTMMLSQIEKIATHIVSSYKQKGKVFFCGNGGSAADAQHLSAELSGRYYIDRPPLAAEALHVNSSFLTAVANDYSFEETYARMIQGFGNAGDILIALSTSGNSKNIVRALQVARERKLITIGLSGSSGGDMFEYCDVIIKVPSEDTPRIQECHMLIGHTICQLVEASMYSK